MDTEGQRWTRIIAINGFDAYSAVWHRDGECCATRLAQAAVKQAGFSLVFRYVSCLVSQHYWCVCNCNSDGGLFCPTLAAVVSMGEGFLQMDFTTKTFSPLHIRCGRHPISYLARAISFVQTVSIIVQPLLYLHIYIV